MPPPSHSCSFALIRGSIFVLMVPLVGCMLGGAKQASVPPPPKPAAAQPAAPEAPLSVPQTSVVLPSPQPVNEDAIPQALAAPAPVPEKVQAAAPPSRPKRRPVADAAKEAEQEAEPPAAPVVEEKPPFQPILSEDEQRQIKGVLETRRKEIRDLLGRAKAHPSSTNQALEDRIDSFVKQSDDAAQRGDYRQADALSERAWILAKELQVD